ncbi:DUF4249 domain-containing protein [Mucilaginibacter sp. FT3.2]|uniref:DUF4249 domain-containing protein n=1 Tax=Mucilaginibacter sp. FT3.2 TaxID=2723090 RepID=UPI00161868C1|nr:DUF4249 domain-containing protein [Mucilaginibacter sp. FT3.2]MBB6232702.1 hypothetical protein [Mucilaginibacter sp. FT3.2]
MNRRAIYTICLLLLAIAACRKAYTPPAIALAGSYLVVEGVINSGGDSTILKLSRTLKLNDTTSLKPETGAVVTLEGEDGTSFPQLQESPTVKGSYINPSLILNAGKRYRLRIKSGSSEYLSDFAESKTTPPIDSVTYVLSHTYDAGLRVNVNTHDATGKSIYYRWDYAETYQYRTPYDSRWKSNGDTVLPRNIITDDINHCWRTVYSNHVVIGSSEKLSRDVISQLSLTVVPSTSEKISEEYSILVKQYALTKEAYQFWENLQKNTEKLGSVFDAQPSQLPTNIHCISNPAEPVIGYLSICTVTSQRIFVPFFTLPNSGEGDTYLGCSLTSAYFHYRVNPLLGQGDEDFYYNYNKPGPHILLIPFESIIGDVNGHLGIVGHAGSTPYCVDCTVRGSNKKPSFWK